MGKTTVEIHIKVIYFFNCVCACRSLCEVRRQLGGVGSIIYHMDPGDPAQAIGVGSERLYPLSHLSSALTTFKRTGHFF